MTFPRQEAARLLARLEARGCAVRYEADRFFVAGQLLPAEAEELRRLKLEVLSLAGVPTEAQLEAIGHRAWDDPPDFGAGCSALRESALVWDGRGWVAMDPAALEAAGIHNRACRARAAKEQHRKE